MSEATVTKRPFDRERPLFAAAVAALVVLAAAMRFTTLGNVGVFTFDDGVYWQTLRAMHAGYRLYGEIFFSQPPLFAFMTFAVYELGGRSIGAARGGVAIVSLLGIGGAGMIGATLLGRGGALAAMALMVASPFFLRWSQTLEGDAAAAGLALLCVAFAYRWTEAPQHRWSPIWALGTGATAAAAIMTKVVAAPLAVPLICLWVMGLRRGGVVKTTLVAATGFLTLTASVLVPVAVDANAVWDQTVSYHLAATPLDFSDIPTRYPWIELSVLGVGAVAGTLATLRTSSRVAPIFFWMLATAAFLALHNPTWPQHTVMLIGPLAVLAALNVRWRWGAVAVAATVALGLAGGVSDLAWRWPRWQLNADQRTIVSAVAALPEGATVLTDSPYFVAVAGRDTPPTLVDPSYVRIRSGYLTMAQLRETTALAVLTLGDRLEPVEAWMPGDFQLAVKFRNGARLWVRE